MNSKLNIVERLHKSSLIKRNNSNSNVIQTQTNYKQTQITLKSNLTSPIKQHLQTTILIKINNT